MLPVLLLTALMTSPAISTAPMPVPLVARVQLPAFPEKARLARAQDTVIVAATVLPNGGISNVHITKASATPFNTEVLNSVLSWSFQPCSSCAERPLEIQFRFSLDAAGDTFVVFEPPSHVEVHAAPVPVAPIH
jgi:TonB family protein